MNPDTMSLSDLTRVFNEELADATGRPRRKAFRTKAEALARVKACLADLKEPPGFRRMKKRLGEEGSETLRQTVLKDRAKAVAEVPQAPRLRAGGKSPAGARVGAVDARTGPIETLGKPALLRAYNEVFCTYLGGLPIKNFRTVGGACRKIRRALEKVDASTVAINASGEVALS
jgi:hypothetical protein